MSFKTVDLQIGLLNPKGLQLAYETILDRLVGYGWLGAARLQEGV